MDQKDTLSYLHLVTRALARRTYSKLSLDLLSLNLVADIQGWSWFDELVHRSTLSQVKIHNPSLSADAKYGPYTCVNDFVAMLLPRCVAAGKVKFECTDRDCAACQRRREYSPHDLCTNVESDSCS